jgi:hypothetical protein
MKPLVIAAILVLGACTTSKPIYLADGREGHTVNCSGKELNWDNCYQKAGEICEARGYQIISRDESQDTSMTGTQFGFIGGTNTGRVLVIACK